MIATVDGPRTFQSLAEAGDDVLVYAWHPRTKLPVVRMMERPHKTCEDTPLLEVEFDSGLKVRCTYNHGFYSFRGAKVRADTLRIGQSVRAWSTSRKVVAIREAGRGDVYNGCVHDAHTYIILDPTAVAGEQSGIVSANCGEIPLRPYEACVLGSVNLAAHVKPRGCGGYMMDWKALFDTAKTLTEMLDNIIERQSYPLPEIEREQKRYRKIGVGVMGYADALILLGDRYGSPEALRFAEQVGSVVQDATYAASHRLAIDRGPYAGYDGSTPRRRNLNCQAVAPTGTISRLAECSFGIEPIMAAEYDSFVVGQVFREKHPLRDHPAFVVASDVTPEQHIITQAVFQNYVDQAVSKTVNLPPSSTWEDVERVYLMAWKYDCKGVTVLREGSRENVVIKPQQEVCVSGACEL